MKILSVKKDVWPLRWHQLAVMLDAGLPIEKAIYALGKNSNETEINQLVASVQSGESFSLALTKIKTINDFDRELLSCAEKAGCLSKALAYLAELKITKKQNIDTLRAHYGNYHAYNKQVYKVIIYRHKVSAFNSMALSIITNNSHTIKTRI